MNIYESGENYLETILLLRQRRGYVRSIDVARELGFSKPSVSRAMGILREGGLISVDDGAITLTPEGEAMAEQVYERHCVISDFLSDVLGVSRDIAEKDACRIEHVISSETFERIKAFGRDEK